MPQQQRRGKPPSFWATDGIEERPRDDFSVFLFGPTPPIVREAQHLLGTLPREMGKRSEKRPWYSYDRALGQYQSRLQRITDTLSEVSRADTVAQAPGVDTVAVQAPSVDALSQAPSPG
jgi:hypothetical protein